MTCSRSSRGLQWSAFIILTSVTFAQFASHAQRRGPDVHAQMQSPAANGSVLAAQYRKLPLGFEPNQGQTHHSVDFVARGQSYLIFLTAGELVLVSKAPVGQAMTDRPAPAVLRLKLVDGNPNPKVAGSQKLPGISHYYIGNDREKWRTNVPQYGQVRYEKVYPGIDLVYYGTQDGRLEHDFVVAPGRDPGIIAFTLDAVDRPVIAKSGNLIIQAANSAAGLAEITLQRPLIYQDVDGRRREISGGYELRKDNRVGFRIGPYDRARPLVIDPVLVVDYSTFLGGGSGDTSYSLAVNPSGNAHVMGQTLSINFPTASAMQNTYGGSSDHFVAKLTPDGSNLEYSTYLGGSDTESLNQGAIALDSIGNAYVAGGTQSADFPTTPGAFQTTPANPGLGFSSNDGYIVKLDSDGTLVYSTLLGGTAFDAIYAIDVDTVGNAYVTGHTQSPDFPLVLAMDSTQRLSFITKLAATGSALVYSTYFAAEAGTGMAVDLLGNAILTGFTRSPAFPVVAAAQPMMDPTICFAPNVPCGDAFVSKVNPLGTGFVYSTFLGGNNLDRGNDIDVDASGSVYVIGDTLSTNFPTMNALQPGPGGMEDGFVTKLTTAGMIVYSTYLGGSQTEGSGFGNGHIVGLGIVIDGSGSAYLSGATRSADFPAVDAMMPFVTGSASQSQAFIAKLNAPGAALDYSTPVNPPLEISQAVEIGIDAQNDPYIAGGAGDDFPTTAGAFQPFPGGGGDAYILKLTVSDSVPTTLTLSPAAATNPVGTEHCVTATVRDANGTPTANVVVRFAVTGAVNTSGSGTTNVNGESSFCYLGPSLPGADVITAFADTDADNTQDPGEPPGAAAKTWVLPGTTPSCEIKITNGGMIVSANGDTATFGGNAKSNASGQTSGQEQYLDHGPVQPLNVHSINVQAITCDSDVQASIYGQATINGAGSFNYRIRVQDNGEPGVGHDRYGILLSNGYNSGDQVLVVGNVQILRD
jgi:beta-propeller repeat-containing protein